MPFSSYHTIPPTLGTAASNRNLNQQTLIKSCETSLSPTPTGSDPTSTTNTTTPTTATTTTTSPAPNPTTPSEESSDAQKSTVVHMDVKQDRARKLLEALSSNEEDG